MNLETKYRRYIEDLTGIVPAVTATEGEQAGKLPLYLRGYYRMAKTRLFGRQLLLAIQNPDTDIATPTEYARHYGALRTTLGEEVLLVLPQIASYGRRQFIRLGIPFVVPHRQVFLPPLLVDLRERFPQPTRQPADRLTAAAQVVLLRHLLGKPTQGISLRELAGKLGYSAMTLSTVWSELAARKLCTPIRKGRSMHLVFPAPIRTLWERAVPYLQNPVKARHWVRWMRADKRLLQAGLTALAASSMVSDDELPTYAMKGADYRRQLEKGVIVGYPGPEGAQACLECWIYDPHRLSHGPTVDRLSLYLSLRKTDDERVAKALKTLLEDMPW